MKADVKENWLAALRSGEYKQAQKVLIAVDSVEVRYCCLGVLCDLAVKAGVEGVRISDFRVEKVCLDEKCEDGWHVHEDEDLPVAVADWAGLNRSDPWVGPKRAPLSQYNDGSDEYGLGPHDFAQIANIIERDL